MFKESYEKFDRKYKVSFENQLDIINVNNINIAVKNLVNFLKNEKIDLLKWSTFITLTYPESIKYNKSHIEKLFKKYPNLIYFGVLENSNKNKLHYHIIVNKYIDIEELKLNWLQILDIKKLDSYIHIYVVKIISIYRLLCYFLKGINDDTIKKIKKEYNIKYLNIWFSNIENYNKLKNENDLKNYEKELESLTFKNNFEKYENNKEYSYFLKITDFLFKNIIIDLRNNEQLKNIYINIFNNDLLLKQLVKSYIYIVLNNGVDKNINKIMFLKEVGDFFKLNFSILKTYFPVKKIDILELDVLEVEEMKQSIVIGNNIISLISPGLDKYIKIESIKEYDKYKESLIEYIFFKYQKNFLNFIDNKLSEEEKKKLNIGLIKEKYLMVIKPNNWIFNDKKNVINGGYIDIKHPFIINDGHGHKFKVSRPFLDCINYMQSISLNLNWNLINLIKEKYLILLNYLGDKKYLEKKIKRIEAKVKLNNKKLNKELIPLDKKITEKDKKIILNYFFESKKGLKYKLIKNKYIGELFKLREIVSNIDDFNFYFKNDIFNSYKNIENVFIPYNIDFRGRVYPLIPFLNFHNSKISRVLFQFSDYGNFNFNVFKIYCVRVYYKEKFNDIICEELFYSKIVFIMQNYLKFNEDFLKANNLFAFLSCCIEYERYNKYILEYRNDNNYKSNFIVSLDATASGSQILTLLLKDKEFLDSLNLVETIEIGNFYLFFINMFKIYLKKNNKFNLWEYSLFNFLKELEIRSFFKNIIMTFNYGLTYNGYLKKFYDAYNLYVAKLKDNKKIFSLLNKNKYLLNIEEIASLFWTFSNDLVLLSLNKLLKKIIPVFNQLNLEINWVTPLNSMVIQKYYKESIITFDVRYKKARLNNYKNFVSKVNISFKNKNKIDKSKNVRAITANYIHSIDSSIMLNVVNQFRLNKLPIACVHDCFFVRTCDVDFVLKNYLNSFEELILNNNLLNKLLVCWSNLLEDSLKNNKNLSEDQIINIKELLKDINEFSINHLIMKDVIEIKDNLIKSKYALVLG